jgi:hypothetical protein
MSRHLYTENRNVGQKDGESDAHFVEKRCNGFQILLNLGQYQKANSHEQARKGYPKRPDKGQEDDILQWLYLPRQCMAKINMIINTRTKTIRNIQSTHLAYGFSER